MTLDERLSLAEKLMILINEKNFDNAQKLINENRGKKASLSYYQSLVFEGIGKRIADMYTDIDKRHYYKLGALNYQYDVFMENLQFTSAKRINKQIYRITKDTNWFDVRNNHIHFCEHTAKQAEYTITIKTITKDHNREFVWKYNNNTIKKCVAISGNTISDIMRIIKGIDNWVVINISYNSKPILELERFPRLRNADAFINTNIIYETIYENTIAHMVPFRRDINYEGVMSRRQWLAELRYTLYKYVNLLQPQPYIGLIKKVLYE